MGETSKVGISASKVVALIAALVVLREAIAYFYIAQIDTLYILWGIIALIIAVFVFLSLEIIDLRKIKVPYIWWVLLILGIVLLLIALFYTGQYLGCTLLLTAFLIEFMSQKKTYTASKIVILIGSCIAIYECIRIFMGGSTIAIVNAVFGLIFAIILIIAIFGKFKIPFAWWIVLIAGFVIFVYVSPFYLGVAGTVIMVGFILILLAY